MDCKEPTSRHAERKEKTLTPTHTPGVLSNAQIAEIVEDVCCVRPLAADYEFARAIEQATIAAMRRQELSGIFLVVTGEVYEGQETYTRHEGSPPPLCDFEGPLYAALPPQESAPVPEGFKLLKDTTRKERMWAEDFAHENGHYINTCHNCLREFEGHKRRVTCKACAAAPKQEKT